MSPVFPPTTELAQFAGPAVVDPEQLALPLTLIQVLQVTEPTFDLAQDSAPLRLGDRQQQWQVAVAALEALLLQLARPGILLAGPVPVFSHLSQAGELSSWIFTTERLSPQLLPAEKTSESGRQNAVGSTGFQTVPLLAGDPLGAEQFCLLLTPAFQVVLVTPGLAAGAGNLPSPSLQFSFAPEAIAQSYATLRYRVALTRPYELQDLDALVATYPVCEPDYRLITRFSQLLLQQVTSPEAMFSPEVWEPTMPVNSQPQKQRLPNAQPDPEQAYRPAASARTLDLELLQAIAHEVRTPLTTIKTLTQLLLKRIDLPREVQQRLESIYRECAEQIDRFSLIFRAAELESSPVTRPATALASVSLGQVFAEGIPRWQKQAARRQLTLEVLLPPHLPSVKSDPTLLDQVLTGLIEHVTHTLPDGSHIQVEVTLAGHQLKLQVRSPQAGESATAEISMPEAENSALKSIGHLLMLQPETGNLSLSLPVTKNLFQFLGGKLTVRKRADQQEILTLFLPLGPENQI